MALTIMTSLDTLLCLRRQFFTLDDTTSGWMVVSVRGVFYIADLVGGNTFFCIT